MKKKVTAEAIRQYADASRDSAAFHFNPEAAKKAGFKRPIAHGMYIMGLAHSLYLSENPTHWIQSTQMTFVRPLMSESLVDFAFELMNEEVQVTVAEENGEVIARGCFTVGGVLDNE
ncbi:MaoC family dehydratase [Cohnella zeiphila]|uniref:MaoC family dehydratase n=1 Tax=Cohnella zeiphila TaxID=2761120 RepID=A0A7X0SX62_9BACL|nr:MaoC family dehydratase [Cohnella zeiphila]MBB6735558.1 MaoC family dehydratase [Cohnella zeiphila]